VAKTAVAGLKSHAKRNRFLAKSWIEST